MAKFKHREEGFEVDAHRLPPAGDDEGVHAFVDWTEEVELEYVSGRHETIDYVPAAGFEPRSCEGGQWMVKREGAFTAYEHVEFERQFEAVP